MKKYIAKPGAEERGQLNTLIDTGKRPARQVTKARIPLQAGASDDGDG